MASSSSVQLCRRVEVGTWRLHHQCSFAGLLRPFIHSSIHLFTQAPNDDRTQLNTQVEPGTELWGCQEDTWELWGNSAPVYKGRSERPSRGEVSEVRAEM